MSLRGLALGELVLPRACAGCGRAGSDLCGACRLALRRPPHPVRRRLLLPAPVWALGPYGGAHKGVIVAMKERGHHAAREYVGAVLAAVLAHLQARGELPSSVILVPAPTRTRSARLRGGDPVEAVCRHAASMSAQVPGSAIEVARCLVTAAHVADQSELDAAERVENMRGAVQLRRRPPAGVPLVVVDDVITTGATLCASMDTLTAAGGSVVAGVTLADA